MILFNLLILSLLLMMERLVFLLLNNHSFKKMCKISIFALLYIIWYEKGFDVFWFRNSN